MTTKKPKIGRPSLSSSEGRNLKLELRLNASENISIEKAAKKATGSDRKKSEWARGVLITEADKVNGKKSNK